MKKQTKLLIVLFLVITGGYFAYNYMYQDHRDIQSEEAKVTVSASGLVSFFKDNKSEEILNNTVQISGKITEMDAKSITLDDSVQCSFDQELKEVNLNDKITVKGRCIGFDDLFEIAKLDQSTIIK